MQVVQYVLLGVAITAFELCRSKRTRFDPLWFFNVYFVLCYVIAPVHLLVSPNALPVGYVGAYGLALTPLYVALAYSTFIVGWLSVPRTLVLVSVRQRISEPSIRGIFLAGLLLFGIIFLLFLESYGGWQAALTSGAQMRYGYLEGELGTTAFAKNLMPLGLVLFYVAWCRLFLEDDIQRRPFWVASFSCLIVLNAAALLIQASRGAVLAVFVTLFLMHHYTRKKGAALSAIALVGLSLAMIVFGKQALLGVSVFWEATAFDAAADATGLDYLRRSGVGVIDLVIQEVRHPILSLETAMRSAGTAVDYTWYSDFAWSLLRVVPQRLVMAVVETPPTISLQNSILVDNLHVASIPPGLLGHFAYAGGVPGLVIGTFVYGVLGRMYDNTFQRWLIAPGLAVVWFAFFTQLYGGFVSNGDPHVYIYSLVVPVAVVAFLMARSRTVDAEVLTRARPHIHYKRGGVLR